MPTPVGSARQCLTPEAAQAIDEAVAIARRRGNSQTTSLHAVSALLVARPSSTLRDACGRARNAAYSARLQLKALELCLNVSLERVPSGQPGGGDPPISNSLMAAIKRSQANQRRQPEYFHLYRDISQQNASSSISVIKVELQNLILSILDDPLVSRVFEEAGFRSTEIKLAIIRPLPGSLLRYSRNRGPPVFLCNLEDPLTDFRPEYNPGHRTFSFPFPGFSPPHNDEEIYRRVREILVPGRTPLLLGVCAYDTLSSFIQCMALRKGYILDEEISTLNVISIEEDVSHCVDGCSSPGSLNSRFEEIDGILGEGLRQGTRLLVNFGDLKQFVGESNKGDTVCFEDMISYVIGELTKLLKVHAGKLVLIGAAESNEIYSKFVCRFPSIEKEWDLQILPITSLGASLAGSYPRSSLMESFVPFGGFFPTPSELNHHLPRCNLCNDKCEQEVVAVSNGDFSASVADRYRYSLSSYLQMAEPRDPKGSYAKEKQVHFPSVQTRDDGMMSNTMKVAALQNKWNNICQHIHRSHSFNDSYSSRMKPHFPTVSAFEFTQEEVEAADKPGSENPKSLPNQSHAMSLNSDEVTPSQSVTQNRIRMHSKDNHIDSTAPKSPCSLSSSSVGNCSRASFVSASSVMTDLSLAMSSIPQGNSLKTTTTENHIELGYALSGSLLGKADKKMSSAQSSTSSSPDNGGHLDPSDFKKLLNAIKGRVGRQDEAAEAISLTVARCRAITDHCHEAGRRGDIWLNFNGSDRSAKLMFAVALAEVLHGSRDNFICVDLGSPDGISLTHTIFLGREVTHDLRFWGKTVADYIAEELSKRPSSVVFLENVDKADMLLQSLLCRAIRIGLFSNSCGRDISIANVTFVTTSMLTQDDATPCYSEDRFLEAKSWPIKMVVEYSARNPVAAREGLADFGFLNKRKLVGPNKVQLEIVETAKRANRTSVKSLDLNIPADDNEVIDIDDGHVENDLISKNSRHWFHQFVAQVHANVDFKPFDLDTLARTVLNNIGECFRKVTGTGSSIEVDSEVMDQLLGVRCLSYGGNRVFEGWVERVLGPGFAEVGERHKLTAESVVKLVRVAGCNQEPATGSHLPSKVTIVDFL